MIIAIIDFLKPVIQFSALENPTCDVSLQKFRLREEEILTLLRHTPRRKLYIRANNTEP